MAKKPKGNLNAIIYNFKKDKNSDDEFNRYLKEKLLKEGKIDNVVNQVVMPTDDLSEMGQYLLNKYQKAMHEDNDSLNAKLDLGRDLKQAKEIIAEEKIGGKK